MIGGTKGKVCTNAAFLSRREDVLASHGYKKQWKPNRAFNSSYSMLEVTLKVEIRKKGEEVIKRKVCQRKRIL